jgi:hypothetical protein
MDALGAVPMNPFVPKKVFPVAGHESDPVPLRKIFVLDAPDPSTKELKIRRCSPAEACIQVVAAAYNLDTTVRSRSQSQLKYAASIAETVDVSVVSYPRELSHVDRVAEAVSASFLQ